MRILPFILTIIYLFWVAKFAYAVDAPALVSPSNGSTTSSSTLNWQTPAFELYSSNPYRVQVDDMSSFPSDSIFRDTYKGNTTYTPVLTEGTWYWRVKVRDTTGTWSDWSNIWSFTLSTTTSSPTPTPTSNPTSTPSQTPASSSSPQSSFIISNIPSQINSDKSFNVSTSLSLPSSPNSHLYLKGAFKKSDSSNYFGQTKVSGSWVKNGANYSSQFKITTDDQGSWSGNLEVKVDNEDSGFSGSGDYIFKLGRYSASGSGPTWSNELTINITKIQEITDQSEQSESLTSNSSTSTPSPTPTTKTILAKKVSENSINYQLATVAGITTETPDESTPSSKVEIKSQQSANPLLMVGTVLVFAGIGSLGYIYLKRK